MASGARSGGHRRRNRTLGFAGQVAGIFGIVLCLLLGVASLYGRGWATDSVDSVSQRVDQAISRALPPLTSASSLVTDVSQRVGEVADAADGVAAEPTAGGTLLTGLR